MNVSACRRARSARARLRRGVGKGCMGWVGPSCAAFARPIGTLSKSWKFRDSSSIPLHPSPSNAQHTLLINHHKTQSYVEKKGTIDSGWVRGIKRRWNVSTFCHVQEANLRAAMVARLLGWPEEIYVTYRMDLLLYNLMCVLTFWSTASTNKTPFQIYIFVITSFCMPFRYGLWSLFSFPFGWNEFVFSSKHVFPVVWCWKYFSWEVYICL